MPNMDTSPAFASIAIRKNVTAAMICNAFVGAFEGGSSDWIRRAELVSSEFPKEDGLVWWGAEKLWEGQFEFDLTFDNPDKGPAQKTVRVTRQMVIEGLQWMADKEADHFLDLVEENDDATTHDVFVQCIVFGKTIYG